MDPTIRIAMPEDASGIARVHVQAWQAGYRGIVEQARLDTLNVDRRAAWWEGILRAPPFEGQRTWVALEAGHVEGFATAGHTRDDDDDPRHVGELQAIYIAPSSWRRGIGSSLMRVVLEHLTARAFDEATVWVLTENLRGRSFYETHGWSPDGASKHEVWDGAAMDEVRYRRRLTP